MRHSTSLRPALFSVLALAVLAGCGSHGQETLDLPGPAAAKVDPELRRTASQLLSEGKGDSLLSVLVRVDEAASSPFLESRGMRVDTVVGDVLTGWIQPRSLAEIAALDEVIQIEPARQMQIK